MKPLVSILIPAYNAEKLIAETLQSAVAQTWQRKEIIVANDGSTDRTAEVAREFAHKGVTVVSRENGGQSAAQNTALRHCNGDYIQWLDADDLLASDKIERQLAALREGNSKRVLLSSPWAPFYYRTRGARFVRNSLCQDLSPVEWLLKKMSENLHMQNATWLVSRELTEAAGPWNEQLQYDQDGEYFTRVLLASEGTQFVPETGIYYRSSPNSRISHIGASDKKRESLLISIKLHIQYLRSVEDSERVQRACLIYMQNWYSAFYPERPDLSIELQALAAELRGHLQAPRLHRKYAWMTPVVGLGATKWVQSALGQFKDSCYRYCDKTMHRLERAAVSESR
jgi:glycosyltransferase involved in cell wall biosynthesis